MATFPLYGGSVLLDFDEKRHRYTIKGKPVISVTGVAAPKPALVNWAAKEAAIYVLQTLKPGVALDEIQIKELADGARMAHSKTSSRAASIGTLAHEACESFAKTGVKDYPVNDGARASFVQFLDWWKTYNVALHASEAKVYHLDHNYCGTLDLDCEVSGSRCIVDIKTSNAIYSDYRLQVAAYAKARERELGIKYDCAWILRLPKDGGDFEAQMVGTLDADFEAFLGLLKYYRWSKAA
jgi:hypothetical protein